MRVYKGVIEHGIELCFKYSLFITVMIGEGDQEDRDEMKDISDMIDSIHFCLLYTSPSPRDATLSRMPSFA